MVTAKDITNKNNIESDDESEDRDSSSDDDDDDDEDEHVANNKVEKTEKNDSQSEANKSDIENITKDLESALKLVEDEDVQERKPSKREVNYKLHPYSTTRTGTHLSGGTVSHQNSLTYNNLNSNYAPPNIHNQNIVLDQPSTVKNLDDFDSLCENNETFEKFLQDATNHPLEKIDGTIIFTSPNETLEDSDSGYEISNEYDSKECEFTTALNSPGETTASSSHSDSFTNHRTRTESYSSTEHYSPESSIDNEASLSPSSSLGQYLPTTLSSKENETNGEAVIELRDYIDANYPTVKYSEWIRANSSEDYELIGDLKSILIMNEKITDEKLVQIYADISVLLKIERSMLTKFFLDEKNILQYLVFKKNSLLLRYVIEIMQSLDINPENIGISPNIVMIQILEYQLDMSDILKTMLSIKTRNDLFMFDMNCLDQGGWTVIHHILYIISHSKKAEDRERSVKYLGIFLNHNPDLTLTTSDSRTYLHHAINWQCGPQIVKMLIKAAMLQNPSYDLVSRVDNKNLSALDMILARKEVPQFN